MGIQLITGTYSATITMEDGTTVRVHRDLTFDGDFDGTWLAVAYRPELAPLWIYDQTTEGSGSVRADHPQTMAFVAALAALIADPDATGDRRIPKDLQGQDTSPETITAA